MDFPYIMPSKFHCIVIMKIHLIYSKTTLEFNNEKSLLDHLEKNNIHHEYVKIKKGKVSYKDTPLAFIQPDEILLCCCHVESDIEIDL